MTAHAERTTLAHTRRTGDWRQIYAARVSLSDTAVVIWAVFAAQFVWFGLETNDVNFRGELSAWAINYWGVSLILIAAWLAALTAFATRGDRILGTGTAEYQAVIRASFAVFGSFAIIAFLLQIDFSRGYLVLAAPVGLLSLLFTRWLWRQWLNSRRERGEYSARVLVVGSHDSVLHTTRQLSRQSSAGYFVVGAAPTNGPDIDFLANTAVPILPGGRNILASMHEVRADTVVIASNHGLSPEAVKRLSWSLEAGREHLVVAPSLIDIGGPRIHTRPVAGLPLVHVETPRYEGFKKYQKRIFDIVASVLLILTLSPVLIGTAAAVKLTSRGPVLFRQERVGLNDRPFKILKFRSMRVGAAKELDALLADQGTSETPLFKITNDPRITRIGGVLRRYSLDELPQLFNVLGGTMSLVGPRPQIRAEVSLYDSAAMRRLLVKPGITGLWQVSGRSNLSWEETVKLDLSYVENWSMTGDLGILWRTAKAVIGKDGAY